MDKEEIYKNLNQGILEERLYVFQKNLDKNLPLIKKYGGLKRIVDIVKGKSAVVIGAGPSLTAQLDVLKKNRSKRGVIYLAADMALKPLMKHGIKPHFVFACETNPVNYFYGIDTYGLHLAAFSCMSHSNIRAWKGDISFYNWMIDSPVYNALWQKAGGDLGFLGTGSIVTTQAVSFAMGCTANSVVMVGNDLGFSERYYAVGTAPYAAYVNICSRTFNPLTGDRSLVQIKKEYELKRGAETYYTNSQFLAAKYWLEDLSASNSVPVYDCSEPGCSGASVKKIMLKDFFKMI